MFGTIASSGGGGSGPPVPVGPVNPVSLFGAGEAGGYWDFTNAASLAVNSDGTGGVPAVGAEFRSALDLSPNGHRLRNTVNGVTRLANGMLVHGEYGLFSFLSGIGAVYGDWTVIPVPFEIIVCIEQVTFDEPYSRIFRGNNAAVGLLQGSAAGKIVLFSGGVSDDIALPMATEAVVRYRVQADTRSIAINNSPLIPLPSVSAIEYDGFFLGPAGDSTPAQIRFKHALFIGRALTNAESAGVAAWMEA